MEGFVENDVVLALRVEESYRKEGRKTGKGRKNIFLA